MLYTGVTSDGINWIWTPVPDTAKQFIASPITDIFVLDSTHAWLCTAAGSMIGTTDGGASWTPLISGYGGMQSLDTPVVAASFLDSGDGWPWVSEPTTGFPMPVTGNADNPD